MISLLLVDDHPVVRDGLRGMFSADPRFEVLGEAGDGAEAIAAGERLRPDVILMDLRMPGTDGVSAIRALAERGVPSRVLVLTTYDTYSDVTAAIEAGATGYLLKDSPREELFRASEAVALGQAALAPTVALRLRRSPCGCWAKCAARRRAGSPHGRWRCSGSLRAAPRTARLRAGCSSARQPSRRTCCTPTPSSA